MEKTGLGGYKSEWHEVYACPFGKQSPDETCISCDSYSERPCGRVYINRNINNDKEDSENEMQ